MNRLLITRMDGRILSALLADRTVVQLDLEDTDASVLGNIYSGKVKNIVKNINAAFVEFQKGQNGYYSLTDNRNHLFADASEAEADPDHPRKLREGAEIFDQVSRDALKTTDPVLTSNLSFAGKYTVITAANRQISFSSKIGDETWKREMKERIRSHFPQGLNFGIIVRTNARQASEEQLLSELDRLQKQYETVLANGRHRTCFSLLLEAEPAYISRMRDTYTNAMEEIVTDQTDVYEVMRQYLTDQQPEDLGRLRLYQDDLISLKKLYSLDAAVEGALNRRVWLKSGGYLVIDYTEAMTVIDVNTGKYTGKKTVSETIRKINLEAAEEIARQLRLRNLSGMIIIDFIDMEKKEDQEALLKALSTFCAKDPVKTTVLDITRLNLVEVTRKKIRKPFLEAFREKRES